MIHMIAHYFYAIPAYYSTREYYSKRHCFFSLFLSSLDLVNDVENDLFNQVMGGRLIMQPVDLSLPFVIRFVNHSGPRKVYTYKFSTKLMRNSSIYRNAYHIHSQRSICDTLLHVSHL